MSYFAVVSGDIARLSSGNGRFVPLAETQGYVTRAVEQIMSHEDRPFYLWDDGETGTSTDLVTEGEEHLLERGTLLETSLYVLLSSAEACAASVYIWWAGNAEADLKKLPRASTLADAVALMKSQLRVPSSGKQDIGLAFRPSAR